MKITAKQRKILSNLYEGDSTKEAPVKLLKLDEDLYWYLKNLNPNGSRSLIKRKDVYDLLYPKLKDKPCEHCGESTKFENNCKWSYATFCSTICANQANTDQRQKTVIEKYGVTNISHLDSIKAKKVATCLENHGVEHPQQSKRVRAKSIKAVMKRYGVSNVSSHPAIQKARELTMIERFGSSNVMHNPDMLEYTQHCAHRVKKITIKGKTFNFMGYEDVFLNYLVNTLKVPVKDITTKARHMPEIWYTLNGKTKKYTPDVAFRYNSKTYVVEVKSTWTLGISEFSRQSFRMVKAKALAATKVCNYGLVVIEKGEILKFKDFSNFSFKEVKSRVLDHFDI